MSSHIFCNSCGEKNSSFSTTCKKCGKSVIIKKRILEAGTVLDNRYKIKRLIKSGGMGTVYEALDERFSNTPCAIKEMMCDTPDGEKQAYLIKRFKKEAEMLHLLRHPNLPVVKDYFVHQGLYYLVMDYIEGKDLESVMKNYKDKGVPEYKVIQWSKEILEAFHFLHSQDPPIVYRDLKPGNIMLRNSDEKIILVDFGIARPVDPDTVSSKTVIGTPAFSSEEIFQGNPEPRSDIYSLGATMHSLFTGIIPTCPFSFSPVREINPNVSKEMAKIISKALEREPKDRFHDVLEMKKAMEKLDINISAGLDKIEIHEEEALSLYDSHAPTIEASYPESLSDPEKKEITLHKIEDAVEEKRKDTDKEEVEEEKPEIKKPVSLKRSCFMGCAISFVIIIIFGVMVSSFREGHNLAGLIFSGVLWGLIIILFFETIKPLFKRLSTKIKLPFRGRLTGVKKKNEL